MSAVVLISWEKNYCFSSLMYFLMLFLVVFVSFDEKFHRTSLK